MTLYDQVIEAVPAIQAHTLHKPGVALILGSGLGDLVAELRDAVAIPYAQIPHFAHSTAIGHAGRLLIGMLEDVPVVVMQGRLHLYEGYSLQVLTLPVRVMHSFGAHTLIVTNAAGGINAAYRQGDFMLIRDHINMPGLAGASPLVGPNDERFGERFPALAQAYDAGLRALARSVAAREPDITLHEGVYTMVGGPSYETGPNSRFWVLMGTKAAVSLTAQEALLLGIWGLG